MGCCGVSSVVRARALAGTFFVNPLRAAIGAAAAMTIESLPLPVNDNLVVPLLMGAVLTLAR